MSAAEFLKAVRVKAKDLQIDAEMLKRPVNVGFSGGEKKRNEILQMAMLEPKMCILDETDSGLDVDAMKLVADGVNALRDAGRSFLVITHYQRLLDHIVPDVVHIMSNGRMIRTGGAELALEVERNGYADLKAEVA
jgi:Fe-S cluster assembly ATP-binding protein